MSFLNILTVSLGAALAENFVFSRFLGITSFLGGSKGIKPAVKTGAAVMLSLTVASVLACILDWALIAPLGLEYMRTVLFVLVLAGVVRIAETVLLKKAPSLYEKLGISFSLVTANAALLGVMLLTARGGYNILEAAAFGAFAGAGYTMAISLFAAVRERLEYSDVPEFLEGLPITLITAGLIALAFMGFSGMKFI